MGASAVAADRADHAQVGVPEDDRDDPEPRADAVRRGGRPRRDRRASCTPSECIVAVNNKDIRTQEREPGDIDQSRSLLEATIAHRHAVPGERERDHRPGGRGRARRRGLQGAPDRDRPAARRRASASGSTSSSSTGTRSRPRGHDDEFAGRPVRRARRAASRRRRALVWQGEHDLLRRPARRWRRRPTRTSCGSTCPTTARSASGPRSRRRRSR